MWSKPFESLKRCVVGLALATWAFSAASSSQTPALIAFSLVVTAWEVQAQTSRVESAASYLIRGNDWFIRGEMDRAIGASKLTKLLGARH